MDAWWQCEVPYPFVPPDVLNAADPVGASVPNRYCDPKIAADLFEEVIDEFLLCDDLGMNVLAVEHHAGVNSLLGANPLLVGILARQTRQVRILSLGTLISLRKDPVRVAEEYATAAVISRRRLELGFLQSGGSQMASPTRPSSTSAIPTRKACAWGASSSGSCTPASSRRPSTPASYRAARRRRPRHSYIARRRRPPPRRVPSSPPARTPRGSRRSPRSRQWRRASCSWAIPIPSIGRGWRSTTKSAASAT